MATRAEKQYAKALEKLQDVEHGFSYSYGPADDRRLQADAAAAEQKLQAAARAIEQERGR